MINTGNIHLRFGPKGEAVLLVLGEARVGEEDLEEFPDVRSGLLRSADGRRTVREAHAYGLINVKPAPRQ